MLNKLNGFFVGPVIFILGDMKALWEAHSSWLTSISFAYVNNLHGKKATSESDGEFQGNVSLVTLIGTFLSLFFAIVILPTETYEQGV